MPLYFFFLIFFLALFQLVYNIENMVWLYWSVSTPPTPGTDARTLSVEVQLLLLSQPLKAQGADLNSLESAVLRPSWPQTIPCSCLPVAWITELSHQSRHLSHQSRHWATSPGTEPPVPALSHQSRAINFRAVSHVCHYITSFSITIFSQFCLPKEHQLGYFTVGKSTVILRGIPPPLIDYYNHTTMKPGFSN
jgi:hypothetical protein